MKTVKVLTCLGLALFLAAGAAYAKPPEHIVPGWAKKEFQLNLLAYKGISIEMLMGQNSLQLGTFVGMIKTNLQSINDSNFTTTTVKLIKDLDDLSGFLDKDGGAFKSMTLRELCIDSTVKEKTGYPTLLGHFVILKADKLTLPWLQAMETNTIYKLWQLIVGTRFVQLTNEWELSDFFSVTCDNPEVDEELIAATEIGLDAGAFGILHQLWAELTDIKALSCCDRTKTPNVCKNCPTQSANCGIAGTPCPVGATPCR